MNDIVVVVLGGVCLLCCTRSEVIRPGGSVLRPANYIMACFVLIGGVSFNSTSKTLGIGVGMWLVATFGQGLSKWKVRAWIAVPLLLSFGLGYIFLRLLHDREVAGQNRTISETVLGVSFLLVLSIILEAGVRLNPLGSHVLFSESARDELLPFVTYLSIGCTLLLLFPTFGGLAFAVIIAIVLVVQAEFRGHERARETFLETVECLGALCETGGYAKQGHHKRVSNNVKRFLERIDLSKEVARTLPLVALMHDVGYLTLISDERSDTSTREAVSKRTGELIRSTGYLASQAHILEEQGLPFWNQSMGAQVLFLANVLDESPLAFRRLVRTLSLSKATVESPVLDAARQFIKG